MAPRDSLQMRESTVSIPARELELRQPQQRVGSLWGKRIIDNYMLVITLGVGCTRGQASTPEKRLRIQGSYWRSCRNYRVDQRSSRCSVAIADKLLRSGKDRISRSSRNLRFSCRRTEA